VCAAVCACHGLLHYEITEFSFTAEKFKEFLEGVAGTVKERTHIFLDNCKVHHAKSLKGIWEELDLVPIWNVPYKFDYNSAIEKYWALVKKSFRDLLLKRMLDVPRGKDLPLAPAVREAMRITPTSSISSFVLHGLAILERDATEIKNERKRFEIDK